MSSHALEPATTQAPTNPIVMTNNVVFSSGAKYHPIIFVLLSLGPLSCLLSAGLISLDQTSSAEERKSGYIVLACTGALVILLYLLVLPQRFLVYSNGSIGVQPILCGFLFAYKFHHVVRAFHSPGLLGGSNDGGLFRPRFKFATHGDTRVVVRRGQGKWDIVVSPQDPQGFIQAIQSMVTQRDQDQEELVTNIS